MGRHVAHKRHNVSVLLHHNVCPATYRRAVFTPQVDAKLKAVCREIQKRYAVQFIEIGAAGDRVRFLVQSEALYSPKKAVRIIKSITAREIFKACPELKPDLWGGKFWSGGYFIPTVGAHGNEQMIQNYVGQQGKIQGNGQLRLF